jgi:hypothetical protein
MSTGTLAMRVSVMELGRFKGSGFKVQGVKDKRKGQSCAVIRIMDAGAPWRRLANDILAQWELGRGGVGESGWG